ncbi:hypothetical protein [Streptomyces melanogenes]|uniref:hypothetical protein n=1 Tax=Streptomyces melanogenes TaxID=67326 RepID=UPI0037A31CD0
MTSYRVCWEIDLDASGPVHAARKALAIHRDPGSWATVFTVHGGHRDAHQAVTVDLDPEGADPSGNGTPRVELTA